VGTIFFLTEKTVPTQNLNIRPALKSDSELILKFISELADYEKLAHEVVATSDQLEATLFGDSPFAEVLIAEWNGTAAGFALFFTNYSTFLALPGIYLEDLFVRPEFRGFGIGKDLLVHLAGMVVERGWGRLDWSVLDWNDPAINFYKNIGAKPMNGWTQFRLDGEALVSLTN
jgi:GNAT superfamily N-acetyltransferase